MCYPTIILVPSFPNKNKRKMQHLDEQIIYIAKHHRLVSLLFFLFCVDAKLTQNTMSLNISADLLLRSPKNSVFKN